MKKGGARRVVHLDAEGLVADRRVLGTSNDPVTIEAALGAVRFARELRAGAEALGGMAFEPFDRDAGA